MGEHATAEAMRTPGDDLLEVVYAELKAVARRLMANERPGHTLQTTALVHEAYARLAGERREGWCGRAQYFAAAAEGMRRVLIEHARARDRIKRGGGARPRKLDFECVADLAGDFDATELMSLDGAIRRLGEELDPRLAETVRLRFYAGLSVADTAEALGVTDRTVKRDWAFARAWLFQALRHPPGAERG